MQTPPASHKHRFLIFARGNLSPPLPPLPLPASKVHRVIVKRSAERGMYTFLSIRNFIFVQPRPADTFEHTHRQAQYSPSPYVGTQTKLGGDTVEREKNAGRWLREQQDVGVRLSRAGFTLCLSARARILCPLPAQLWLGSSVGWEKVYSMLPHIPSLFLLSFFFASIFFAYRIIVS